MPTSRYLALKKITHSGVDYPSGSALALSDAFAAPLLSIGAIVADSSGPLPSMPVSQGDVLKGGVDAATGDEVTGYVKYTKSSDGGVEYSIGAPGASRFGDTIFGGVPIAAAACNFPDALYANITVSGSSSRRWVGNRYGQSVKLAYVHWFNNNTTPNTDLTVNASVQIDAAGRPVNGKKFQIPFGGKYRGTMRPFDILVSDPAPLAVEPGIYLWTITNTLGPNTPYKGQNGSVAAWFEGANHATGVAGVDWTPNGQAITANGSAGYSPIAVIGDQGIGRPYVWIDGASNDSGTGDTNGAFAYGKGMWARLLRDIPHLNTSFDGRQAGGDHTYQRQFAIGTTDIIFPLGMNDLMDNVGNQSVATVQSRIIAETRELKRWAPKAHIWQVDFMPHTTSSDAWAAVENQTVRASEAKRLEINAWFNDGMPIDSATFAAAATGSTAAGVIRCGRVIGGVFAAGDAAHPIYGLINISNTLTAYKANGDAVWKPGYCYVTDNAGIHLSATACAQVAADLDYMRTLFQTR